MSRELSEEERMRSYEEFRRHKVEIQKLYRAKRRAQEIEQGAKPKRKYVRRSSGVTRTKQNPEIDTQLRPQRSSPLKAIVNRANAEANTVYVPIEEYLVSYPDENNAAATIEEEDTSQSQPIELRSDDSVAVLIEEEEEDVVGVESEDQTMTPQNELSEAGDSAEMSDFISPDPAVAVYVLDEDEEQPMTMTAEAEQEAFYNKRDIILRLMDQLKKGDRLLHLDQISELLRFAVQDTHEFTVG